MPYHTIVQGEHISGLAEQYGFSSYKRIWDHGQNAELKKKRQNPNVLFPGDRLFIPDKEEKKTPKQTEKKHPFKLKAEKLKLRLVLEDQYEKPISNASCLLHLESDIHELTTDGKGKIEKEIPATVQHARLIIRTKETCLDEMIIPIEIGHLDPVDEMTGQQARLANLGYFTGSIDALNSPLFLLAVEEFQCDYGLAVDGVCGPHTQAKLKSVHGC